MFVSHGGHFLLPLFTTWSYHYFPPEITAGYTTSLKNPLCRYLEDHFFYYIHFPAKICSNNVVSGETKSLKHSNVYDHINVSYIIPQREKDYINKILYGGKKWDILLKV